MRKFLKICFYMMMALYILLVVEVIWFSRIGVNLRGFNLIPFRGILEFISQSNASLAMHNIGSNILMFVPMGIYLKCLFLNDSLLKAIAKLSLISLFKEIIQYILAVGIINVDDLILNVLGE